MELHMRELRPFQVPSDGVAGSRADEINFVACRARHRFDNLFSAGGEDRWPSAWPDRAAACPSAPGFPRRISCVPSGDTRIRRGRRVPAPTVVRARRSALATATRAMPAPRVPWSPRSRSSPESLAFGTLDRYQRAFRQPARLGLPRDTSRWDGRFQAIRWSKPSRRSPAFARTIAFVAAFIEFPQACIDVAGDVFDLQIGRSARSWAARRNNQCLRARPSQIIEPPANQSIARILAFGNRSQRQAGWKLVGMSFKLCTAMSIAPASSASSISLVNNPFVPDFDY